MPGDEPTAFDTSGETSTLAVSETMAELPPLRIHHLLAWMAVTALWLINSNVGGIGNIPAWLILTSLLAHLGWTMAVTCCAFGLWWRHRRSAFPRAPGHWICILFAVGIAFSVCIHFAWMLMSIFAEPLTLTDWFHQWGWRIPLLPYIALELWIAKSFANTRRWMWFFLASAIFLTVHLFAGRATGIVFDIVNPLGTFGFSLFRIIQFLTDAYQIVPSLI